MTDASAPEPPSPADETRSAPDPAAPAFEPTVPPPPVESTRRLLGASFDLLTRTSDDMRRASFYIGLVVLGTVGPFAVASFAFGGDVPSVGASGAIFGLFGVLLTAGRIHHPIDRQSRGIMSQLLMLVVINIIFGFASNGAIDNAAHLGGLAAGLWIGALVPPTGVPTMSSLWQRAGDPKTRGTGGGPGPGAAAAGIAKAPGYILFLALAVIAVVVVAGLAFGTNARLG